MSLKGTLLILISRLFIQHGKQKKNENISLGVNDTKTIKVNYSRWAENYQHTSTYPDVLRNVKSGKTNILMMCPFQNREKTTDGLVLWYYYGTANLWLFRNFYVFSAKQLAANYIFFYFSNKFLNQQTYFGPLSLLIVFIFLSTCVIL